MDIPILDELAGSSERAGDRAVGQELLTHVAADGQLGAQQPIRPVTDPEPGTPSGGGFEKWDDIDGPAGGLGWLGTACAWCGQPITARDSGFELDAVDPQTDDNITLTVCCAEHKDALMSHRSSG